VTRIFAALIAAVPFAFGVIRAITTGWDLRYLIIATASLAGAVLGVRIMGTQRRQESRATTLLVGFVGSLLFGAVTGWVQGARSVSAIVFVAGGFALCEIVACALYLLSRPRTV
jgi:hypothetical protein